MGIAMRRHRPIFANPIIHERACIYSVDDYIDMSRLPENLTSAVRKRQVEFLAGRDAARRALLELRPEHTGSIGIGPLREPVWPTGVVGSITHTQGYAAAAVASAKDCIAIGIDIERVMSREVAAGLAAGICCPGELGKFGSSCSSVTIAFSAKESLYKCLSPSVRKVFDFHHAQIEEMDFETGGFEIHLTRDLNSVYRSGWRTAGRFFFDGELVHTGVALVANGIGDTLAS
jgi:enterobactin synthetase component D